MTDTPSAQSSDRAIANLLAAYAFRNDDADIPGLGDLFAEAVFTLNGDTARGKAEIEAMAGAIIPIASDGRSATSHEITNISIEVNETTGTATASSYWTLYNAVSGEPRQAFLAGHYQDAFGRKDGVWRFTRRDAVVRWSLSPPHVAETGE
jgi:hypothetical protein